MVWAGLYGAQLSLKLSLFDHFRSRFLEFGGRRWFKKLIDIIDDLLNSITAATGIDEALKELKELLGHASDDEDDEG